MAESTDKPKDHIDEDQMSEDLNEQETIDEAVSSETEELADVVNSEIEDQVSGQEVSAPPPAPSGAQLSPRTDSPILNLARLIRARYSFIVALLCSLFVFMVMNFNDGQTFLIFQNNTPTGGDMGAHVWGPAFLRDHLLPNLSLSGWAPDWYQGFPAYRFYMVVPALAIVILNIGLQWWVGVPLGLAALFGFDWLIGTADSSRSGALGKIRAQLFVVRMPLMILAGLIAISLVHIPYGIAFKIVAVLGIVTMPLSGWAMGKLARLPEPGPPLVALGVLIFLFDTNFSILGGNILSTLAGEFSFSISFSLVLLAIGMTIRAVEDRVWFGRTAVLIALAALSHVIPVFFLVPAVIYSVFARRDGSRAFSLIGIALLLLVPVWINPGIETQTKLVVAVVVALGIISVISGFWNLMRPSFGNLGKDFIVTAGVGFVGLILAAFWFIPFGYTGEIQGMFNDMGWIRELNFGENLLTGPMRIALPLVFVGFVLSFVRQNRLGLVFSVMCGFFALLYVNIGESALWNQRLLPTFYITAYIAAAIAVGQIAHLVASASSSSSKTTKTAMAGVTGLAFFATVLGILVPLARAPFGQENLINADGEQVYSWAGIQVKSRSSVQAWATWNFTGLESKPHYREFRDVVSTMEAIGSEVGCGRAFWEFNSDLDRYGTPMTPMLLPFFTDGCIDSMEGLFFESSASTPFHFLNQSRLSIAPSTAQRFLPYQGYDINAGVDQMQLSGIRYYMASSDDSIQDARNHPDLREITAEELSDVPFPEGAAFTNAFVVFEHREWAEAAGLEYLPIVVTQGRTVEDIFEGEDPEVQTSERADIEVEIEELRSALEENGVAAELIEVQLTKLRAELFVGLERETEFKTGWAGEAVDAYNDPASYLALPAEDGPQEWPRTASEGQENDRLLPSQDLAQGDSSLIVEIDSPAVVSNYSSTNESISFDVDEPGKPVIVRTSYFPNWKATGAAGPWRVGPNQMVVIPTDTQVELNYTSSWVERGSNLTSLIGLLGIAWFYRRRKLDVLAPEILNQVQDDDVEVRDGDVEVRDGDVEVRDDDVEVRDGDVEVQDASAVTKASSTVSADSETLAEGSTLRETNQSHEI